MTTNRIKAGLFSDGGRRLRVVAAGYDADPAPSDPSKIIFDSDWGELLPTDSSHYGVATINTSTSWQTVTFPNYGYVPFAFCAFTSVSAGAPYPAGQYFPAQIYAAAQSGGYTYAPIVEVFADHLRVYYNPYTAGGGGYSAQIKLAWCVVRTNCAAASSGASRAGTNWMSWSPGGILIAKPGRDISSANADDFLVNATTGAINTQPLYADTVSSLPLVGSGGASGYYTYTATITHGLGYVPMFWVVTRLTSPNYSVSVDTTSLTISVSLYQSSPVPTSAPMTALAYSILRQQWV